MRSQRPILLVEDDRVDAMTVKRALKEIKVSNPLRTVGNGEEALAYLRDKNNEKESSALINFNKPSLQKNLRKASQDRLFLHKNSRKAS